MRTVRIGHVDENAYFLKMRKRDFFLKVINLIEIYLSSISFGN